MNSYEVMPPAVPPAATTGRHTRPSAPLRIQQGRRASWEAVPAASWLPEPAPRAPSWHAKWYTGTGVHYVRCIKPNTLNCAELR